MTIDQIMNLDAEDIIRLQKENPRELRKLTSQLAGAARKRIARVTGSSITPPVVKSFVRSGGVKSIRGMNIKQVTTEFQRLKGFVKNPQSTLKGARQFAKETAEKLGVSDLTPAQFNRLLDVWGRIRERYGDMVGVKRNYDKVLDFLHDEITSGNNDIDSLLDRTEEYLTELYENQESAGGGTSGFFTV